MKTKFDVFQEVLIWSRKSKNQKTLSLPPESGELACLKFMQFSHPIRRQLFHHHHPTHQPPLHHLIDDIYFQQPTTTIKILMKQTKQILCIAEQKYIMLIQILIKVRSQSKKLLQNGNTPYLNVKLFQISDMV